MKNKHTPGPWCKSERGDGAYRIYGCGAIIAWTDAVAGQEQVGDRVFKSRLLIAEANAELIASAPDLKLRLEKAEAKLRIYEEVVVDCAAQLGAKVLGVHEAAEYLRDCLQRVAKLDGGKL